MNKIIVTKENIILELNQAITFENNQLIVKEDSVLCLDFNNSMCSFLIKVLANVKCELFILGLNTKNIINYILEENSNLIVNKLIKNCSDSIEVILKKRAILNYNYSTINTTNNKYIYTVRQESNSISVVNNYGLTLNDKKLEIVVNNYIAKDKVGCLCNQDNKIINYKDNSSTIKPNLYIESEDIVANHSAFIGMFEKEVLFYLNTRGVGIIKAKELLAKSLLLGKMKLDYEQKDRYLSFIKKEGGKSES